MMDDEVAYLLFKLIFGNQVEKEKADMQLRKRGIPPTTIMEFKRLSISSKADLKKAVYRLKWDYFSKFPFENPVDKVNWIVKHDINAIKRNDKSSYSQSFVDAAGLSVGITFVPSGMGYSVEIGIVYTKFGKTGYFSYGPAFGTDVSLDANLMVVNSYSHNKPKPFIGSDLAGKGITYNFGFGPFDYSYGGNIILKNGIDGLPQDYAVHELGVTFGMPASASIALSNTYTFPMPPTFFGIILMPNPF